MALVFISHASADKKEAEVLFQTLQESGFSYLFLDFDEKCGIKIGEEWEKRLYHEIKRAHIVILLISPAWIASKWCFAEYQQAKALGKEILSVIIDHGDEGAIDTWFMQHLQLGDLTKDQEVMQKIIARIKEIALDTQKGFLWDIHRSPYPGLVAFEEEDAAVFFARDSEIRAVVEKLQAMKHKSAPKFLNIVAASGLGKSSLLKAGIIPRMRLMYKTSWVVLPVFRPAKRPLYELAKLFAGFLNTSYRYKEIYVELQKESFSQMLDDIVSEISFLSAQSVGILFAIDQAEEFYTLSEQKEREQCFRVLCYLLDEKENFFMIWTLRADYLKFFQSDNMTNGLQKHESLFTLGVLAKEHIASIIQKPAEIAGISIEDMLIERLKEDTQTTDALPLLALTLYELYVRYGDKGLITLNDYQNLGEEYANPLENIVQKRADEAIRAYQADEEILKALKNAFIPHLVRINDTHDGYVKQKARYQDMPPNAYEMLELLVDARLLIKRSDDNGDTLEISHEALIRTWGLLKCWIEEEESFLIWKRQLEMSLKEWQELEQKEKKKALLSGIRLQKAIEWREKLSDTKEIVYVDLSILHQDQIRKKRRMFLTSAFSLISSFAVFSWWEWYRAEKSQKIATQKSFLLQHEIKKAKHNIGLFFAEKAKYYLKQKRVSRAHLYAYYALLYLDYRLDREVLDITVGIVDFYGRIKLAYLDEEHQAGVYNVLITSDNKTLISASDDRTIIFKSLVDGKILKVFKGHKETVYDLIFIEERDLLISASKDKTIKFWRVSTGELIKTLKGHQDRIYRIILTPDKRTLISSSCDKTIRLWDMQTFVQKKVLHGHTDIVSNLAIRGDGKVLYSSSNDKCIGVWDMEKLELIHFLTGHTDYVYNLKLIPGNNTLVSSSKDRTIRFWDTVKYETKAVLKGHLDAVHGLVFIENYTKLISSSSDWTIRIWDLYTNEVEMVLDIHKEPVYRIACSNDETTLAAPSWDMTISIWDITTFRKKNIFTGHEQPIFAIALVKEGNMFLTASRDRSIRLWDRKKGAVIKVFKGHKDSIYSIVPVTNGKQFFSCSSDKTIKMWDIQSGNCLKTIRGHTERVYSLALSADNSFLISGSEDRTVRVWDLQTFKTKYILKHTHIVYHVALSKDDRFIASTSFDKNIRVWEVKTGKLLKVFKGHQDSVYFVMFDKSGRYIYSSARDKEIRKWDLESGKTVKVYKGHTNRVYWLDLTSDEKILASSSRDNTIRLWDTHSAKTKHILKGHTKRIYSNIFTPDGKNLISVSWDKTIKYWDVETGKLLRTLKEYPQAKVLSPEKRSIKLADGKVLDIPTIQKEIKILEKEYQSKIEGIKLVSRKQPFKTFQWSKTHPLYKKN